MIYAKIVEESEELAHIGPFHAFIVDKSTPGLSVSKPMDKMGMHSSPTGEVFLADVRVPGDQLLGGKRRSIRANRRATSFTASAPAWRRCASASSSAASRIRSRTRKQRETWGKKIAEYQLIQDKLARMYVHRENVRNLLFRQFEKAQQEGADLDGRGLGVQALLRARRHRGARSRRFRSWAATATCASTTSRC